MPWQDRIREAAYRSPNGTRTVFLFQNVSRTAEKKTSSFDFPDADGTLVQDLGRKGRRYPLRIFFAGDDHDIEADAFEEALLERGAGVLEHPRYGQVDVVPFGEITQRDDLKTAANQTIIEVVFWATIGTAYPTGQTDGALEALAAVDDYTAAAAESLEEAVQAKTKLEEVTFRDQWEGFLDNVESAMQEVADAQEDITRQFNDINDSINRGLDVLVGDPLTLASQTLALIKAPARALALIEARLEAYGNLATSIVSGSSTRIGTAPEGESRTVQPTNDNRAANEVASRSVFAQGAVAGSVTATMAAAQNSESFTPGTPSAATAAAAPAATVGAPSGSSLGGFDTQPQAIAAAETVLAQLEQVTAWSDNNYRALEEAATGGTSVVQTRPAVDTGGAYQQLQKAVAIAAGVLVELAFNLRKERRIVLDKPRSIVDFVAEYYGNVDESLDFFINTNDLTGSEILELPKGRTVVVYG
jgi:hypothetical protein